MIERVAIVTATPQSVAAGSGTFVATEHLRIGLERLGHEVTVVHPHWPALPRPYLLRRWRFNRGLDPGSLGDATLVIGIDLDGFTIADRIAAPFIAYVHGQLADEARFEQGPTRWSMLLQARWERRAVHRAARVLTPSDYSRARVAALYGVPASKIAVVPAGIDVAGWAARVDRARRGRPGVPTILAVAHLYPRKNLIALVDAALALSRRGRTLRVRIVGDGPERRRLEHAVERRGLSQVIELSGFVPDDALPAAFAEADVFCLPTLQEGFGIVFVEAMAAGLPIAAYRAGAIPEVVADGETGMLVAPDDTASLVTVLERLLEDGAMRRRMAQAGRERAARFTRERAARALLAAARGA